VFNVTRYINLRFSYLLAYLLTHLLMIWRTHGQKDGRR